MKEIDPATLAELLKPQARPRSSVSTPKHEGPLQPLISSAHCVMCQRGERPVLVKVMYSVNGEPLCSPHAMYVLSTMLIDAGINFAAEQPL